MIYCQMFCGNERQLKADGFRPFDVQMIGAILYDSKIQK